MPRPPGPPRTPVAVRLRTDVLSDFDAAVKARGISRTAALEIAMGQFILDSRTPGARLLATAPPEPGRAPGISRRRDVTPIPKGKA